jgi:hypothetical protein
MAKYSSSNDIVKVFGKKMPVGKLSPAKDLISKQKFNISKKPLLITASQSQEIGNQINLVAVDPFQDLVYNENKPFSPRIINYVEPYLVSGFRKSLFYTEVNSGLKVGDRVFIINGNYDSDLLIKSNKYRRGRDGYKVLYVDRCQVVLDIDYTGVLPYNDDELDSFIKIYYVEDERDFIHVNRQVTTRGGTFSYKFNYYQNNIVFSDNDYPLPTQGYGANSGLVGSPGFFVKDDTNSWTDITSDFINLGTYSVATSPTYQTNDRVKILNGTFTYNNQEFKEGFVYKWEVGPTQSLWVVDVKYNKPFITKGNFRDGDFDGTWNVGLFGRQDKKIKWTGNKSTWQTGTLLNTNWIKGKLDSKFTLPESYLTEIDNYGLPYQKLNAPNNNGRGYNFVVDSEIENTTVSNATILNTSFGTSSNTYSSVEYKILSITVSSSVNIAKGYFEDCTFRNSVVNNSEIRNSNSKNTQFNNIKSINSHYKKSVISNSEFISDNIIKILGYDEYIMSERRNVGSTYSSIHTPTHKIYKFYIDRRSFDRLRKNDNFYIKGLKINDNQKKLVNFFDKKFTISHWNEYVDFYYDTTDPLMINAPVMGVSHSFYKRGIDFTAFLSTPEENSYKYTSVYTNAVGSPSYSTSIVDSNSKKGYSIDLVVSMFDTDNNKIDGLNFNYNQSESINTSPTMSNYLGNIVDFTNAYIIDSDFESGLFEYSNWNNGININQNSDVNITKDSSVGGYYNLSVVTASSLLIATTSNSLLYPEADVDFLTSVGDVLFLNAVDYDTRGKVDTILITPVLGASGSGYITSNGVTTSNTTGIGSGLTVDITATVIGEVTGLITSSLSGTSGLGDGSQIGVTTTGTGTGLTLNFTVASGLVSSVTINTGGSGYSAGETITITGGSPTLTIDVDTINNGEIILVSPNITGIQYSVGDILNVNSGNFDGQISIISTTGSLTRLPDSYKVLSNINSGFQLEEIITGTTSVLSTLLDGGLFLTDGVENRYGYLHRSKFSKSKIKSGLFKRSYINDCLIQNDSIDITDRDFNTLENIKSLLLSDMLFANNKNILSRATYVNSHFKIGSDYWDNGILFNSVWNSGTFSRGLVKESTWLNGIFEDGLFYQSRSFNALPDSTYQYYDVNRIKNYHRSGVTSPTISNDRYSWENGSFIKGEFFKSDWENGQFKNGKFYNSKWYGGTFSNGVIGDITVPYTETKLYNGTINYAIVNNSSVYAIDTSFLGLSNSTITWKNGIFNSGIFGSDILQYTASHIATWEDGVFNGGEFMTNGKWKNGIFNGGKFTSGFGWDYSPLLTNISTVQSEYGWEDGEFNGGEFGTSNTATNSVWYTGEFNGGKFKGRIWNDGVFTSGEFLGSSTYSAVGGYDLSSMTESNVINFVDSYSQDFYGLWNSGYVTNVKDDFIKNKKIFTEVKRAIEIKQPQKTTIFKNMLWMSGTFSHPNGEFNNSVWLDGSFNRGKFKTSSFNPYVKRNGDTSPSFNLNDDLLNVNGSCIWNNGVFDDSDFYISQWKKGSLLSGTAFGMVWKDGTSNYMNAYNIFWENGTWRNGNWYGSYYQFDGTVTNPFAKQILFRGMSWSGTASCHIWNVFRGTSTIDNTIISATTSEPTYTPIMISPSPLKELMKKY